MAKSNWAPFLFYGQSLYKVEGHQGVHPLEPPKIDQMNPKYK
jgi:hypothetical protein